MAQMAPHHSSMRGVKRAPRGYGKMKLSADQGEFIERMALEVFSDMTMNGHTFVQAIAAVYLTGLENGAKAASAAQKEGE